MKQTKCVLISLFILFLFASCTKEQNTEYEGILNPKNGIVIATINGEDFHYARDYLFFRDLTVYPENAGNPTPEWISGFSTYGEMALGIELLYREALENHYILEDEEKCKAAYEKYIDGGILSLAEINAQGNDSFSETYQEYTVQIPKIIEQTKEEYHLDSNSELAEYTYPIYKKGYTASMYLWQEMNRQNTTQDIVNEEISNSFWEEYYSELLKKYNVNIKF